MNSSAIPSVPLLIKTHLRMTLGDSMPSAVQWLGQAHFIHILPLVRRTFSAFSASERSDLGQRARQGVRPVQAVASAPGWDEELAALPLPLLRSILGVEA